jgi:FtsH-binding integral membrane protein
MEILETKPIIKREAILWTGLVVPPVLWLCALTANYGFAHPACKAGEGWLLFATPLMTMAIILLIGVVVWFERRPYANPNTPTVDGRSARARFMANLGLVTCLGFAFATAVMLVPPLLMNPCD